MEKEDLGVACVLGAWMVSVGYLELCTLQGTERRRQG